ncbi:MAG TPA: hypothetical protein VMT99_00485 [Candidatus Paceibacterota bacterium]|nr:hypothetical protein [Candidatus Paceibacterota bacterium]
MGNPERHTVFEPGDTVWLRLIDPEQEDFYTQSSGLRDCLGSTGPFVVWKVVEAPLNMPCRKLHTQLLLLGEADSKKPVHCAGAVVPLSAFWFTRNGEHEKRSYTEEEAAQFANWANEFSVGVIKAVNESAEITELVAAIRERGYDLMFLPHLTFIPAKDPGGSLVDESGRVKPGVFGDGELDDIARGNFKIG